MKTVSPHWSFQVLQDYFEARGGTDVLENEMLRDFFPGKDLSADGISLELFEKHFLLHRRLYLFDDELRLSSGQRLSIRLIRFRILPPPEPATCGYLLTDEPAYCGKPSVQGLCAAHRQSISGDELETPGLKGFYMDWSNLHTMDQMRLTRLVEGFFHQVFHPEEIQAALEILGLDEDADPEVVRKRWLELSRIHHPDAGGELEKYQRINAAYQVWKSNFR